MKKMNKTYVYASDYAVVTFVVSGEDDWSDEQFDSASQFDLKDYVGEPEDFWLEDVIEDE